MIYNILQYKVSLLVRDLVVAFVLFIFNACIAVFLCCYRFSVNKDLYKVSTVVDVMVLIIASNILV